MYETGWFIRHLPEQSPWTAVTVALTRNKIMKCLKFPVGMALVGAKAPVRALAEARPLEMKHVHVG